jgi:hypothetical protein
VIKLEQFLNQDRKSIKKSLRIFSGMNGENIFQTFDSMSALLKNDGIEIKNDVLVKHFFKALEIDERYKKAFKLDNYEGYKLEEIGKIVKLMTAIMIKKTRRKQKVTDILRLNKQLIVDNMDKLSYTELTNLINAITKNNISRSSVVNFVQTIKKEDK